MQDGRGGAIGKSEDQGERHIMPMDRPGAHGVPTRPSRPPLPGIGQSNPHASGLPTPRQWHREWLRAVVRAKPQVALIAVAAIATPVALPSISIATPKPTSSDLAPATAGSTDADADTVPDGDAGDEGTPEPEEVEDDAQAPPAVTTPSPAAPAEPTTPAPTPVATAAPAEPAPAAPAATPDPAVVPADPAVAAVAATPEPTVVAQSPEPPAADAPPTVAPMPPPPAQPVPAPAVPAPAVAAPAVGPPAAPDDVRDTRRTATGERGRSAGTVPAAAATSTPAAAETAASSSADRQAIVPAPPAAAAAARPDRPVAQSVATVRRQVDGSHRVRPGESLWRIAATRVGEDPAAVSAYIQRVWKLNAGRIGTGSPDVLPVGVVLRLPSTQTEGDQ